MEKHFRGVNHRVRTHPTPHVLSNKAWLLRNSLHIDGGEKQLAALFMRFHTCDPDGGDRILAAGTYLLPKITKDVLRRPWHFNGETGRKRQAHHAHQSENSPRARSKPAVGAHENVGGAKRVLVLRADNLGLACIQASC